MKASRPSSSSSCKVHIKRDPSKVSNSLSSPVNTPSHPAEVDAGEFVNLRLSRRQIQLLFGNWQVIVTSNDAALGIERSNPLIATQPEGIPLLSSHNIKKDYEQKVLTGNETRCTNYRCVFCGKVWRGQCKLEDHMNSHTREKPHLCPLCPASFSQKCSLATHTSVVHKRDKKFKCNLCRKSSTSKKYLLDHMIRHTGEKPYKCRHCKKDFCAMFELQKHMRRIHRDDKKEQRN